MGSDYYLADQIYREVGIPRGTSAISVVTSPPIGAATDDDESTWITHPDLATSRLAALEGEVRVLREMVAAIIASRPTPRKTRRK